MELNPFPEKKKKREEGRQAPEPKKREEGETSTRTQAGTKTNQQIMMEQNPFPEEKKKRDKRRQAPVSKPEPGRQAPEPQPEPTGTSKSLWNRTPFLRKERREKKGDKHRNPSRNQDEPANHDGTEPPS